MVAIGGIRQVSPWFAWTSRQVVFGGQPTRVQKEEKGKDGWRLAVEGSQADSTR